MDVPQTEWNLTNLNNMELAELQQMANRAYISNNFSKALETARAMQMTGGYLFTKSERDELDRLKKNCGRYLLAYSKNTIGFPTNTEINNSAKFVSLFKEEYEKYFMLLKDLLFKYGFFGNIKKDSSKMVIWKDRQEK